MNVGGIYKLIRFNHIRNILQLVVLHRLYDSTDFFDCQICFIMFLSQCTVGKVLIEKIPFLWKRMCSQFCWTRLMKEGKPHLNMYLTNTVDCPESWHLHSSPISSHVFYHSTRISRQNRRSASEQPTAGQGSVWGREWRRVRQGGSNLSHRDSSASIGVLGLKEWVKYERKVLIGDHEIYIGITI